MLIRDGPLSPGTLGLYWRLIESEAGAGVRSYGMKSKTRVSNSKTGLDRIDDNVLLPVGVPVDVVVMPDSVAVLRPVVVDVVVLVAAAAAAAAIKSTPVDESWILVAVSTLSWLEGASRTTDPVGEPEALAAEKATLLKMAPNVLSMELGLSPREKTGRSRSDKLCRSGADVTRCDLLPPPTVPVCLRSLWPRRRRWWWRRLLLIGRVSLSTELASPLVVHQRKAEEGASSFLDFGTLVSSSAALWDRRTYKSSSAFFCCWLLLGLNSCRLSWIIQSLAPPAPHNKANRSVILQLAILKVN